MRSAWTTYCILFCKLRDYILCPTSPKHSEVLLCNIYICIIYISKFLHIVKYKTASNKHYNSYWNISTIQLFVYKNTYESTHLISSILWQHMKIINIQLTSKHQHGLIANKMHINYRPNTSLTCYSSRKLGLVDYKS